MQGSTEKGTYKVVTLLDAVAATTTSDALVIAGAKKATLYFTRASHGSGSSAFSVTVSGDGATFVPFNKLITNVTNTNAQDQTRVGSVSLAANGTEMASLDLSVDAVYAMKVTATETTDGVHTCKVLLEF
jgi:hypothetical protein